MRGTLGVGIVIHMVQDEGHVILIQQWGKERVITNSPLEWSIFLLPFLAVRLILLELKERGLKFMEGGGRRWHIRKGQFQFNS